MSGEQTSGAVTAYNPSEPVAMLVDPDPMAYLLVKRWMDSVDMAVLWARNFEEAADFSRARSKRSIKVVFCEYEIDGVSFARLLKVLQDATRFTSLVLFTSPDNHAPVQSLLQEGVYHSHMKPSSRDAFLQVLEDAIAHCDRQNRLRTSERSLQKIGELQLGLFRRSNLEVPFEMKLSVNSILDAGGDFIGKYQLDENRYMVVFSDVSGHDLKAAFVSAYFQGMVRGLTNSGMSLLEIMMEFNRFLIREWNSGLSKYGMDTSVAVSGLVMDYGTHEAMLFAAGSPFPVFSNGRECSCLLHKEFGASLGWFEPVELIQCDFDFKDGGNAYLWSDGLDALAMSLDVNPLSLATRLILDNDKQEKSEWMSLSEDDVLVASVDMLGDEGRELLHVFMDQYYHSDLEIIDELQTYWEKCFKFALPDLDEDLLMNLMVAVREGVINGLKYGCGEKPDEVCWLDVNYYPKERKMTFCIEDPGSGHSYDVERAHNSEDDQLPDLHRGLMMMQNLSESMELENNGAKVILTFSI